MKALKSVICAVCACVLLLGCLVGAQDYVDADKRFEITLSDEYTLLDRDNLKQNRDFITRLGSSVENFGKAMVSGGIYLYAATENNDRQVQVKVWSGDSASKIGNLAALTDEGRKTALDEIGATIVSKGDTMLETEQVERDGQVFFRYRVRAASSLESGALESIGYCFEEYITVVDGQFVALLFYNSSSELSAGEIAESRTIFDGFKVNQSEKSGARGIALMIFSVLMLLAAVVVAGYVIFTFVRDLRERRERPEIIPDHIKMRRK